MKKFLLSLVLVVLAVTPALAEQALVAVAANFSSAEPPLRRHRFVTAEQGDLVEVLFAQRFVANTEALFGR